MPTTFTRNKDSNPWIRWDGAVDVGAAYALRNALVGLTLESTNVVVDLRGVERMDAAGVQLLLAFQAWTKRAGVRLSLLAPEGAARRALEASGALSRFTLTAGETASDGGHES